MPPACVSTNCLSPVPQLKPSGRGQKPPCRVMTIVHSGYVLQFNILTPQFSTSVGLFITPTIRQYGGVFSLLCVFCLFFVCTVTDFSAAERDSGVKHCTPVRLLSAMRFSHFGDLWLAWSHGGGITSGMNAAGHWSQAAAPGENSWGGGWISVLQPDDTLVSFFYLWWPYVIVRPYIFSSCDFYLFSFFPRLISAATDWIFYTWRGPSANLECRSEMCCARLAANTGRKKSPKSRHLGTIAQLCRTISSQLRHVSTIGKKLVKQQYLLHTSQQYGELWPTSG